MAQKLVVNEKIVKMRELLKQNLRYYMRMYLLNFFVKRGRVSAPVPPHWLRHKRLLWEAT